MNNTGFSFENRIKEAKNTEFLNFIPIEYRGMSILTLLVFCFCFIGFGVYSGMVKREITRLDTDIAEQSKRISSGNNSINDMKTDVALLLQSVTRIEKMLDKKHG
jgi:hypothetical protein